MKITKNRRQYFLKKIINENEIETQEQLIHLLNKEGMNVTQATVSRDIKELNLVKMQTKEGKLVYRITDVNNLNTQFQKLQQKIQDVVEKVERINNLILLKTLPGNAHVIGVLLDEMQWEEMMGCICGNDTCLIITKTPEDMEVIYNRLFKKS